MNTARLFEAPAKLQLPQPSVPVDNCIFICIYINIATYIYTIKQIVINQVMVVYTLIYTTIQYAIHLVRMITHIMCIYISIYTLGFHVFLISK